MKKELVNKNTIENKKGEEKMTNTIKVKSVLDPMAAMAAQSAEYDEKGTELIAPNGFYVQNGTMMRRLQGIEKEYYKKDQPADINYDFYRKEFYTMYVTDKMKAVKVYLKEVK